MILDVENLLMRLSCLVELRAGDLLFTGTPAGVAALEPGDVVVARVDGVSGLEVRIGPAAA